MAIDYESLLARYIAHVGECEGVTYIRQIITTEDIAEGAVPPYGGVPVKFSDEEHEELYRLEALSKEDAPTNALHPSP